MIYIASPYSSEDPSVMEQRFDAACRAAGKLMDQGHVVFSPIAHTHPIVIRCDLPRGWDFWSRFDREFIERSEKVVVLKLDGWEASKGVAAEIEIAEEFGIQVEYMEKENLNVGES